MTDYNDDDGHDLKAYDTNDDQQQQPLTENTKTAAEATTTSTIKEEAEEDKPQTLGEMGYYRRQRFPTQYNKDFDSFGRRRHVEWITDPDTGERRKKTVLEQTGRRKPYKQNHKVKQAIEWRRVKISEYMIMGKSLPEIARLMNIPFTTIYNDYIYLRRQAAEEIKNHVENLPLQIKQGVEGLNKLTSMLYELQDLNSIKAQNRRTSDHVRVLAMNLIKDCIKEKNAILTSTEAISHALNFVEKTKEEIKEKLGKDIEDIVEHDKEDSAAINDAIEHNPELKAYFESMQKQEEQEAQQHKSNLTTEQLEEQEERQSNERMGLYDVVDTEGNNEEETIQQQQQNEEASNE